MVELFIYTIEWFSVDAKAYYLKKFYYYKYFSFV
jgi:hypothetical protein